jgi:hypothetical protein
VLLIGLEMEEVSTTNKHIVLSMQQGGGQAAEGNKNVSP